MTKPSFADRLIFFVVNFYFYARHPKFTQHFVRQCKRKPDYACPPHLEDLVQWRKLFDRNPLYAWMTDKIEVKHWVAERWPDLRAPETVWTGKNPEDLPDEFLTPEFVIKTNNSTSQNYFPQGTPNDRHKFLTQARVWTASPTHRWMFWNPVKRQFLAERRIHGNPLVDVTVRVNNGEAHIVACATDYKSSDQRYGHFWVDGSPINTSPGKLQPLAHDFSLPRCFSRAVTLAKAIGKGWDYLRVDFLAVGDELYLSEITLYPNSGYGKWEWRTEVIYRLWLETLHLSWPLTARHSWPRSLYFNAFRRWLKARKLELGPAAEYLRQQKLADRQQTSPSASSDPVIRSS